MYYILGKSLLQFCFNLIRRVENDNFLYIPIVNIFFILRWPLKGTIWQIFLKLRKYTRVGVYYIQLKNSFAIIVLIKKTKKTKSTSLNQNYKLIAIPFELILMFPLWVYNAYIKQRCESSIQLVKIESNLLVNYIFPMQLFTSCPGTCNEYNASLTNIDVLVYTFTVLFCG